MANSIPSDDVTNCLTGKKDHSKGLHINPPEEGCADQSQVLYWV